MKIESFKKLSLGAVELYNDLSDQGLSDDTIADAMCDGEYLGKEEIPQGIAEEIYSAIK